MSLLNKLPGYQRTPYGLELKILRNTPRMLVYSTLIIGIFVAVAYLMAPGQPLQADEKFLHTVDIMAIAVWITVWTAIFTVAVGAFVVYLMKGPAYVWDPMEVTDSEHPKK